MFFANDTSQQKVYIDDAERSQAYFCPACGGEMIQKKGPVVAHHFAHAAGKECDSWYAGKLSDWHLKMQHQFPKHTREVAIWNKEHTEYHVADVLLQSGSKKCVVEFQHSPIAQSEFLARSHFYIDCGCQIIWVFDFCECKSPKKIYISDAEYDNNVIRLAWPGKDRIRFLDSIDFANFENNLFIVFHVSTGKGSSRSVFYDYHSWDDWAYDDPFHRDVCFVMLLLNHFDEADDFFARRYSEEDFFKRLRSLEGWHHNNA